MDTLGKKKEKELPVSSCSTVFLACDLAGTPVSRQNNSPGFTSVQSVACLVMLRNIEIK